MGLFYCSNGLCGVFKPEQHANQVKGWFIVQRSPSVLSLQLRVFRERGFQKPQKINLHHQKPAVTASTDNTETIHADLCVNMQVLTHAVTSSRIWVQNMYIWVGLHEI